MTARKPWTSPELKYLKRHIGKIKYKEMEFLLNKGRSIDTIKEKALALGLSDQRSRPWTDEEDKYLQEHCGKKTYKEIGEFINRNPGAIRMRAYNLNLSAKKRGPQPKEDFKVWTKREIWYLKRHINTKSYDEMKYLIECGRTPSAISAKAKSLDIGKNKRRPWTESEDKYIFENYGELSYKEMQNHLSNRTVTAIKGRALKLLSQL